MRYTGSGSHGSGDAFNSCHTRLPPKVSKPRQRKRRQNAQHHNDHDQLDQGKTALLFLHDVFLANWLFKLEVTRIN